VVAATPASLGYADLHVHQFANLAFCGGVVWGSSAGGVDELGECRPLHGRRGLGDVTGALASIALVGAPASRLLGHDVHGYSSFAGWPRWDDFTHQSVHRDWLLRAVHGGLRLMVMLAVNNSILCRLVGRGNRSERRDMRVAALQLQAAWDFQRDIDVLCGGPGKGWYRIVQSAKEAREVIANGKLAVVLGLELDDPYEFVGGQRAEIQAKRRVSEFVDLGVRHIFPIHLKDNIVGGTSLEPVISWAKGHLPLSRANPLGTLPVYRLKTMTSPKSLPYDARDARVNSRGLSPTGRSFVAAMMDHGLMIDIDHMSSAARRDVMDEAKRRGYPLVAGHALFADLAPEAHRRERQLSRDEIHRIDELGGVIALALRQPARTAAGTEQHKSQVTTRDFVRAYNYLLDTAGWSSGVGVGSDFNGFAGVPAPLFARRRERSDDQAANQVRYPIRSPVTTQAMERCRSGGRTFDINYDGFTHIGLWPDFIAELQALGVGNKRLSPLMLSADAYVNAWSVAERAAT
jgi:microsomal dipeptidase-like Zn-dependent dipeptidase